jgi:tellurite resistance protein
MPPLDSQIDDLYKIPLGEFVAARASLAKTLTGEDAKRIKALKKPTVVPWAVNQLYWHARPVFDRLAKNGAALRAAQLAALAGRAANVRAATEAHRKAIAEAVAQATRLAARADAHPGAEELSRMLEAVSLTPNLPGPPGRMVATISPPGFEALAGAAIKAPARADSKPAKTDKEEAADERRKVAGIRKAEEALHRATEVEAKARQVWERAQVERQRAANALAEQRAK